jgi:adenylyl-sulfate kinase
LIQGVTVWLTGRPASGKTTVANALHAALVRLGVNTHRLDGDDLRRGLCRDLGFSRQDRAENARRAGGLALSIAKAGGVAIVSLVSPYEIDRAGVRELHGRAGVRFIEVHIDCPLAIAEARDPKGLYSRARAGQITELTGLDAPYEPPRAPDLSLDTAGMTIEEETTRLLRHLTALSA